MDVTAVVLHFRDGRMTARCLRSLQADGVDRVVVVDNSADEGRSWSEAESLLPPGSVPAGLVRLDPGRNLGFAAGVNLGLRHVRARHGAVAVLLLNSDAVLEPGTTARLLAALPAQGPALVAPRVLDDGGEAALPSPRHYLPALGLHARWPARAAQPYLSGCALLLAPALQRDALELDEAFFFYGEDVELSARVARLGGPLLVVQDARCRHRGAGSSRRYSHFYEYHLVRGQRLLARRLIRSAPLRAATWLPRELLLGARALVHAIRSRSAAPLAGWLGIAPPAERPRPGTEGESRA